MAYHSVNPFDGTLLTMFNELTDKQLQAVPQTATVCSNTFEPVALFSRSENGTKAVALAKGSECGLRRSGLHQGCGARQTRCEPRRRGMIFVIHPVWTTAHLPFGGITNSEYRCNLSSMSIQHFLNQKQVRVPSIVAPALDGMGARQGMRRSATRSERDE